MRAQQIAPWDERIRAGLPAFSPEEAWPPGFVSRTCGTDPVYSMIRWNDLQKAGRAARQKQVEAGTGIGAAAWKQRAGKVAAKSRQGVSADGKRYRLRKSGIKRPAWEPEEIEILRRNKGQPTAAMHMLASGGYVRSLDAVKRKFRAMRGDEQ